MKKWNKVCLNRFFTCMGHFHMDSRETEQVAHRMAPRSTTSQTSLWPWLPVCVRDYRNPSCPPQHPNLFSKKDHYVTRCVQQNVKEKSLALF